MFNKEQKQLVMNVDEWAQENNRSVDRKLSDIYQYAKGQGEGWSGIAEEDPSKFASALALALEWCNNESYQNWVKDNIN